jgi:hypothetical protein
MAKKLEERARESYPEYFQDASKIARTATGTIRKEFRQTGLAMLGPIMILDALL